MQVKLLSWTKDPLKTLYAVWEASRSQRDSDSFQGTDAEMEALFLRVMASNIPVGESISFVFLLEEIPISLREQIVRHRIASKAGVRIGADIIPELADSSWWSQGMRILDMSKFADRDQYYVPENCLPKHLDDFEGGRTHRIYENAMFEAQRTYQELLSRGVPVEDARNVIPLGATHRMTWTLNMVSLKHIIGKRSCWIAQAGMWAPIISGMVEELANKVHPLFRRIVDPPCFSGGKWVGCKVIQENVMRIQGTDPNPPCPLVLNKHAEEARIISEQSETSVWKTSSPAQGWDCTRPDHLTTMAQLMDKFRKLWQRDPKTGEAL